MPDLYRTSLLALHIVYIKDDSFSCNLESLKFRLFFQRKQGQGCGLY